MSCQPLLYQPKPRPPGIVAAVQDVPELWGCAVFLQHCRDRGSHSFGVGSGVGPCLTLGILCKLELDIHAESGSRFQLSPKERCERHRDAPSWALPPWLGWSTAGQESEPVLYGGSQDRTNLSLVVSAALRHHPWLCPKAGALTANLPKLLPFLFGLLHTLSSSFHLPLAPVI